ncbi:hypothetical protein MKX07_000355 [Trichoderma sp. CBMAI-0711]|nr:hypothetical protein MKX07_000355 [Trichoderma sp. CBMAI-0711]
MSNTSQTTERGRGALQWARDPSYDYLKYEDGESVAESITMIHYGGDKCFREVDPSELKERECWQQLDTLAPALTLELIATLNLEVILRHACSLAGKSPSEGDLMVALEELHWDLSDDVVVLQRIHHRVKVLSGGPEAEAAVGNATGTSIQRQLERFKQVWNAIVQKLSPGRLANEMGFYADVMEDFVDTDRRYASQSDLEWAEELAISSVRLYQAVHNGPNIASDEG